MAALVSILLQPEPSDISDSGEVQLSWNIRFL